MSRFLMNLIIASGLLMASLQHQAQVLNVSVKNIGNNRIQISGTATAPGFSSDPVNAWGTMSLTWRIPKSAVTPPLTVSPPPAATPEVTNESTAFTGASPGNAFPAYGPDLTIFDLTAFGEPDDGYWYFQVNGTTQSIQDIPTGSSVVLYDFTLPAGWICAGCVELLTSDVPALLNYGISTTSNIYNAGMGIDGTDVLSLVVNNAPLPVRFISFDARKQADKVQLNWRVSHEKNVKGYYVERSANGMTWKEIGYAGAKPVNLYNDYSLVDQSPLNNLNYYRIREEDYDGRKMYSIIRTIDGSGNVFSVTLYPVPVREVLHIKLQTSADDIALIRITDALGRTMLQRTIQIRAGDYIESVPVSQLSNGAYFIEITGSKKKWTGKFLKE
jgi:hypothetical protein